MRRRGTHGKRSPLHPPHPLRDTHRACAPPGTRTQFPAHRLSACPRSSQRSILCPWCRPYWFAQKLRCSLKNARCFGRQFVHPHYLTGRTSRAVRRGRSFGERHHIVRINSGEWPGGRGCRLDHDLLSLRDQQVWYKLFVVEQRHRPQIATWPVHHLTAVRVRRHMGWKHSRGAR